MVDLQGWRQSSIVFFSILTSLGLAACGGGGGGGAVTGTSPGLSVTSNINAVSAGQPQSGSSATLGMRFASAAQMFALPYAVVNPGGPQYDGTDLGRAWDQRELIVESGLGEATSEVAKIIDFINGTLYWEPSLIGQGAWGNWYEALVPLKLHNNNGSSVEKLQLVYVRSRNNYNSNGSLASTQVQIKLKMTEGQTSEIVACELTITKAPVLDADGNVLDFGEFVIDAIFNETLGNGHVNSHSANTPNNFIVHATKNDHGQSVIRIGDQFISAGETDQSFKVMLVRDSSNNTGFGKVLMSGDVFGGGNGGGQQLGISNPVNILFAYNDNQITVDHDGTVKNLSNKPNDGLKLVYRYFVGRKDNGKELKIDGDFIVTRVDSKGHERWYHYHSSGGRARLSGPDILPNHAQVTEKLLGNEVRDGPRVFDVINHNQILEVINFTDGTVTDLEHEAPTLAHVNEYHEINYNGTDWESLQRLQRLHG